jgi:hypothetical protein
MKRQSFKIKRDFKTRYASFSKGKLGNILLDHNNENKDALFFLLAS